MLNADRPAFAVFSAQHDNVAADVDERIVYALRAQNRHRAVERDAFEVAAKIERDVRVAATELPTVKLKIGDALVRGVPSVELVGRG